MSNYATRADLKNATGIDTSSFAKNVDLASLKSNIEKWNIDKLKNLSSGLSNLRNKVDQSDVDNVPVPVPVELSKLSSVVKNNVVKKDVYKAKIKNIKDKIPGITNLATNASLNAKINDAKGEIPSINNLATTSSLTAVENRTPSISNLVKRTDYNTKINEIEKRITAQNHENLLLFQNLISWHQKICCKIITWKSSDQNWIW